MPSEVLDGLNSLKLTGDGQTAESSGIVTPAVAAVLVCLHGSPVPAAIPVQAAASAATANWQGLQIALSGCHDVIAEGQERRPAHGCCATQAHKDDGTI